eukprot:6333680-Pyramimonas_sp.AAC.1
MTLEFTLVLLLLLLLLLLVRRHQRGLESCGGRWLEAVAAGAVRPGLLRPCGPVTVRPGLALQLLL